MNTPSALRIIAAPLIWMLLFVVMYAVQGATCSFGLAENIDQLNSVRLGIAVLALIAGAGIARLGWGAARRRREVRHTLVRAEQLATRKRHEFLESVTLVLGVLSLVGVIWLALGVFMYPLCEGG